MLKFMRHLQIPLVTPIFLAFSLFAQDVCLTDNRFTIGPEYTHLKRTRKGGTKQSGPLYGVRAGFDRLKRYGWYIGAEAHFAKGTIKGHTGAGNKIRSHFTDVSAEGRFGYTFQRKHGYQFAFTPFFGGGYAAEKNDFISPSPLPVHFKTKYPYILGGFLASANPCENWNVAILFKTFFPVDPKCHVTHDPLHESVSQNIGERLQYRAELPITYKLPCYERGSLMLVPFFEYRHYGTSVNYPFDYFKTQLKMWGVVLKLTYEL